MPIPRYLAITPAEMAENSPYPPDIAWMACHFSPYDRGLSNLPRWLPPDSLLILNDQTPIAGHDPELIAAQIEACVSNCSCAGVLLDFQRPDDSQTEALVQYLQQLPCPVAVSEPYARFTQGIVSLPPPPADVAINTYLTPWAGQEIWLEMGLEIQQLILTEQGAESTTLPFWDRPDAGFPDVNLHCHYRADCAGDRAVFTLWREPEDWKQLLAEAEALGVTAAVGLYQEFRPMLNPEENLLPF